MIQKRWMDAINRITGEDGKEPISMIDMDVKIIAGSTQPTNRMAKASVAMEFVKAGIYDPQAALEYIDDPKKDEVTERMERKRKEELQAIAQGQAVKGAKAA
jgi:predicted membrane GTPase involved in stress response